MEDIDSLYTQICYVLKDAYSSPLSLRNPKTGTIEKVKLENYFPNKEEIKIVADRRMMDQYRILLYRAKKKIGGKRSSWEAFKEWMLTSSANPVEILLLPREKLLGGDVGEIYVYQEFLKNVESTKKAAKIIAGMYLFYLLWDLKKEIAIDLLQDETDEKKKFFARLEDKIFGQKELHHGSFTAEEMMGISLFVLEHLNLHEGVHELETTVKLHKDLASKKGKSAVEVLGLKITQ
ncbi:hypothetical protein ACFLQI_00680 [Candidatus Undinarchaeota archaeon]